MKKIIDAFKKDLRTNLIILVVGLLIGAAFVPCYVFWWNHSTELRINYRNLADSCLLVWAIYLAAGLLIVINRLGFFDTLVYGFSYLGHGIFRPNADKKYNDLIDYKEQKNVVRTKRGYFFLPLFLDALVFLLPFIVFNTLFNQEISKIESLIQIIH